MAWFFNGKALLGEHEGKRRRLKTKERRGSPYLGKASKTAECFLFFARSLKPVHSVLLSPVFPVLN